VFAQLTVDALTDQVIEQDLQSIRYFLDRIDGGACLSAFVLANHDTGYPALVCHFPFGKFLSCHAEQGLFSQFHSLLDTFFPKSQRMIKNM
jgi:hypothetical protein